MTLIPLSNLATGPIESGGSSAAEVHAWLMDLATGIRRLPGANEREALTIIGGAITPTQMSARVDTEGGAATDDLDTITGTNLPLGSVLEFSTTDTSRVVTVKHRTTGSGHIFLVDGADLMMNSSSMRLQLQRVSADRWIERWRYFGTQAAAARTNLGLGNAATLALATQAQAESGTGNLLVTVALVEAMLNHASRMITNKPDAIPLEGAHSFLLAQAGVLREPTLAQLKAFVQPSTVPGAVGTYVFAARVNPTIDIGFGDMVNGSVLVPAGMLSNMDTAGEGSGSRNGLDVAASTLGAGETWQCMGFSRRTSDLSNISHSATLWLRMS